MQIEIHPYNETYREPIISVWEKSVRATHDFLTPDDIAFYKKLVSEIDFRAFSVYCLTSSQNVLGFLGVLDNKIEMLFVDPAYIGQGLGRTLMLFALDNLHADKVDVNEENTKAIAFYTKFGFIPYERLEKDSEGKDHPILKMKRP
ncbi:GNAT family N-acetyltransferase [Nibrella saemangeumensis]|uniref:GNAT family N-acetyltransferase n=1 Tax=Nibrella saemangeumensis TaxID=1084526 RepID=A0ABP8MKA3_9BACT